MKKIGLSFFALAVALLAAELIVRVLNPGPDVFKLSRGMVRLSPDPEIRYELIPGYRSPSGDVVINEKGFRDREWEMDKPAGVFRVACIGDSIAFGMGAGQEETFARYLELTLNERTNPAGSRARESVEEAGSRALRYETASSGVPGYNITQIVRTLETKVTAWQPDRVIYLYCLNDLAHYSRELENLLAGPDMTSSQRKAIEQQWAEPSSRWPQSKLRALIQAYLAAFNEMRPAKTDHSRDDMTHFLRGTGLSFYQLLYDDPARMNRLTAGFARLREWSDTTGVPVTVVIVPVRASMRREAFLVFHEKVSALAVEAGLATIDLWDTFRSFPGNPEKELFADPLHPNAKGYRLAAEAVAHDLIR